VIQLRRNYAGITPVSDLPANDRRAQVTVNALLLSGWKWWRGAESNRRHYDFQWDRTRFPEWPRLSSSDNFLDNPRIGIAGLAPAVLDFRFFLDSVTPVTVTP
jgi:alpha-glucosidase (family GH31 glycosyl hydrolase)